MIDNIEIKIVQHIRDVGDLANQLSSPELVTFSHHGENYMLANRSAYLLLAAMALEAACGKTVWIRQAWIHDEEWNFSGFQFSDAPFVRSKVKSRYSHWPVWLWCLGMVLFSLLLVGLFTSIRWLYMGVTGVPH